MLTLLAGAPPAVALDGAPLSPTTANAMAQAEAPDEYRRKLSDYLAARAAFEQEAGAYWNSIAEKRRGRNAKRREHETIALDDYVLTQPPVYNGPKRPAGPLSEPSEPEHAPRKRKAIPVVADLLKAAQDYFQWTPQRPANEMDFKRAYARVATAAGLTREQAVRVYSFETGGTGNYAVQSGIEHGGTRAISTAIGYNQLLTTNTVELLAEQGPEIVKALAAKAARLSGAERQAMDQKIVVLKRMVALARSVPDEWGEHEKIGDTQVAQGDLAGALKSYDGSFVMIARLTKSDPSNAEWQRHMSVSYNKLGNVQVARGDLAGALTSYRDGLAIMDRLALSNPSNAGWRHDLSISYERVGTVQIEQGDLAGALTSYRNGLAITHQLAKYDLGNAGWQFDLGISNERIGDIQIAQGDLIGSLSSYRDI